MADHLTGMPPATIEGAFLTDVLSWLGDNVAESGQVLSGSLAAIDLYSRWPLVFPGLMQNGYVRVGLLGYDDRSLYRCKRRFFYGLGLARMQEGSTR